MSHDGLFLSESELIAGLDHIRHSPADGGSLQLIVVRPETNVRLTPEECDLSAKRGAEGDHWARGCWKSLLDGSPHPEVQVTLMNSRCVGLVARDRVRWSLAGDNLYVDLDLSPENLPPGQRLAIGAAVLEITPHPHTGCAKFVERYGREAMLFVNSPEGKSLRLRGIYAMVIKDGRVRIGDVVRKL